MGGQWIILKGIIIRLDYAANREAANSICIYIQGEIGEGQGYNSTQAIIDRESGLKGRQGKIGIQDTFLRSL
jgi:hypothetical protein